MPEFPVHTPQDAPADAAEFMRDLEKGYGFVPNLAGVMAEAPPLMKGYFTLNQLFDQTTLNPVERQVVLLSVSFANGCQYCMAAHSALAQMAEMPDDVLQALRHGDPLPDERLEALRRFTRAVVTKHGWPDSEDFERFFAAGFQRHQVFEVVLGVGMKTLSNYTNHIAGTPLDQAFASQAWTPPA